MLSSYLILIHAPTKDATISPLFMTGLRAILIHASARDATIDDGKRIANLFILIHASARDATKWSFQDIWFINILIHASARDATAKSYKIGNNFTVLFRKFVQIFDILILHISIFWKSKNNISIFVVRISRDFYVASDSHQLSHI